MKKDVLIKKKIEELNKKMEMVYRIKVEELNKELEKLVEGYNENECIEECNKIIISKIVNDIITNNINTIERDEYFVINSTDLKKIASMNNITITELNKTLILCDVIKLGNDNKPSRVYKENNIVKRGYFFKKDIFMKFIESE